MKIRHFLLLVVVLMSSWAAGCAPARSGMTYASEGGHGEVRGKMNGVEFCAAVEIGEGGEQLRVEYLSPPSLCGLTLTARGEVCEVKLGDVFFTCETSDVVGFLRPITAFLPTEEASTVQKEGDNTVLTFPTGGVLILSPAGEPISLSRNDIEMHVVWWERGR